MVEDASLMGPIMMVVSTQNRPIDIILETDGSNFTKWRYLVNVNVGGLRKGHLLKIVLLMQRRKSVVG